jgi:hypothetical protein
MAMSDKRVVPVSNRLRIDLNDGSPVVEYQIVDGQVERRTVITRTTAPIEMDWRRLTAQELTAHIMANTVVAIWLSRRMGFQPLMRACQYTVSLREHDQALISDVERVVPEGFIPAWASSETAC